MRNSVIFYIAFLIPFLGFCQSNTDDVLRFDEYLAFVKTYHPVVKQANLIINESEAELMRSRGAFDPKIEADYNRKTFKNTEYYDKLNATFKIPTWYGIEFKANFEENQGEYLNPELTVPDNGLYTAGVSFSVAQGFLINQRMASLKQAKLFVNQAKIDRDIQVNAILYQASLAYFEWLEAYNNVQIYDAFLVNAQTRFEGVKMNVELGETAAIDSVEARLTIFDRQLNLEQSKISLMKAKLELSNFLWINDVPVELQDIVIPDSNSETIIDTSLMVSDFDMSQFNIENHPKLQSLNYKFESLDIERRLKANMLLPRIDLQYNFLSETPDIASSFNTSAYKSSVNISLPLFLRKERGDLRLAKLKLQDTEFEIQSSKLTISNKVKALESELESLSVQNDITEDMISDYERLVEAEERKFSIGESSLFLVNSRESQLISIKLKANQLQNKLFTTKATLFNSLVNGVSL
uniref:TolC family protein n=1 Tax=Gelidibacter sp. TaxID=2018083 RepID=UPI00404A6977